MVDENLNRRKVIQLLSAVGATAAVPGIAAGENKEPEYPSAEWFEREVKNIEKTLEAPREQSTARFQNRLRRQESMNTALFYQQERDEPGWNRLHYGREWAPLFFTGDPFRYPTVDPFYEEKGERTRVAFYDLQGARLNGRVWVPIESEPGDDLPAIVICNGSQRFTETQYWWAAQTLVQNGYMVMTFDPRGQGRSDDRGQGGESGSNVNPAIFVADTIAAIDFLHSTPDSPYPYTEEFGDPNSPAPELRYNPYYDRIDQNRLGVCGHSAGAIAVTMVQGFEPWPGELNDKNPIDTFVAWDNLANAQQIGDPRNRFFTDTAYEVSGSGPWEVKPRVPGMGICGDYLFVPRPYLSPPDPCKHRMGYDDWVDAEIPAFQIVISGGTHYEYSPGHPLPTTSWRPPSAQHPGGEGGHGNRITNHYTLAWFDRWLKEPNEKGYHDATDRLLADEEFADDFSFYYESARNFPNRQGKQQVKDPIKEIPRECGNTSEGEPIIKQIPIIQDDGGVSGKNSSNSESQEVLKGEKEIKDIKTEIDRLAQIQQEIVDLYIEEIGVDKLPKLLQEEVEAVRNSPLMNMD